MSTWREAFLRQAQSDFAVIEQLKSEPCHRLHYLQMSAEKLAKGLSSDSSNVPPIPSHVAIIRMLQLIKGRPEVRKALGFQNSATFNEYIGSLLDIATKIQSLAPSVARMSQPNPEYPWLDKSTGLIQAPCDHEFTAFSSTNPQLTKFLSLVRRLLSIYQKV